MNSTLKAITSHALALHLVVEGIERAVACQR
jgi:hypothetical protein